MSLADLPLWASPERSTPLPLDAYAKWRSTPDGERVWYAIQQEALTQWHSGSLRIGINHLSECVRATLKLRLPNSLRPQMADELCARYPELAGVIHRHKRKVRL